MKNKPYYFIPITLLFILILSSCEKKEVIIPEPELTFSIVDTTINDVQLKKISGIINQSFDLKSSYQYLLSGHVFVDADLTIEAGSIFYGDTDLPSSFIINRGKTLSAHGTVDAPIIFTSIRKISGTPSAGDWVGIHINGQASINQRESRLTDIIGKYGRTDEKASDFDNSGIYNYIRVEYAGKPINGASGAFNLNGVGRETIVENVQIYESQSTGFYMRGGSVGVRKSIATQPHGNGFKWNHGWRGFGQNWVVYFPKTTLDTISAIEGRSGSISDIPISDPILSNITIVGLGISENSPPIRGIRLRNSTHARIYNTCITQCHRALRIDYGQEAVDAGKIIFANNNLYENDVNYFVNSSSIADVFDDLKYNNVSIAVPMNRYIGALTTGYYPAVNLHEWFDNGSYIGAIEPNNDWSEGWTIQ